jgi:hypothetical protein
MEIILGTYNFGKLETSQNIDFHNSGKTIYQEVKYCQE